MPKKTKRSGDSQQYPTVDSPPVDPFESLVATFYQIKGYITSVGKWFWVWQDGMRQPGYQDIDVLAINADETIIVSVTSNLDDKVSFKRNKSLDQEKMNKLLQFFNRAQRFLTETPEYSWLMKSGRKTYRVVVCAGWHEKNLERIRSVLKSNEIELRTSSDIFRELRTEIRTIKEKGLKTNDPLVRLLNLWMRRGPLIGQSTTKAIESYEHG